MNEFWPQGHGSAAVSSGRSSAEGADVCASLRRIVYNQQVTDFAPFAVGTDGALIALLSSIAAPDIDWESWI